MSLVSRSVRNVLGRGFLAVLGGVILVACSTPSGPAPSPTGATATVSSSTDSLPADVGAALASLPITATSVYFTDDAVTKKHWGTADVTSATSTTAAAYATYAAKSRNAIVNPMSNSIAGMADWGFNGLDVDWSISSQMPGSPPVTVYRMRPDLDMAAVINGLSRHGYTQSGPADRPSFVVNPDNPGNTVTPFLAAVVWPDRHFVVATGAAADTVAAIDGSAPDLAMSPVVTTLLAGLPNPEFVALDLGTEACSTPATLAGGTAGASRAGAELSSAVGDLAQTHRPTGVAAATFNDTGAAVTLDFADAESAQADAATRSAMMADGRSLRLGEPYSKFFTVGAPKVAGTVLRYDLTLIHGSHELAEMSLSHDTPWAFCP